MSDDLSPLDGRYKSKVEALRAFFSEDALNRHRLIVEVEWLIYLCDTIQLKGTRELTPKEQIFLRELYQAFTEKDAKELGKIEATTNHDVKAIEYFMKARMAKHSTKDLVEWVHFACTSEDINNVSYALMVKGAMHDVMMPTMDDLKKNLENLVKKGAKVAMLAHTHGQPASPTTVGKEIANVLVRLGRQFHQLREQEYLAKMNGAVGNWNAHVVAYPDLEWHELSRGFLEKLDLECSVYTTQIEPHDYLAELAHTLMRFNTILLDLDRDIWMYISKNYFTQRVVKGEVGSSTMPHKVNPIDFENSEGNLGLANALFGHLAEKLPVSRMQRDLSDSTVLRNLGVAFGYSLLAYKSTLRGLGKVDINTRKLADDLDGHWEVLAEALQTVMRRYGITKPYEKLKELTRGKGLDQKGYMAFVKTLKIPAKEKERLLKLTPATYTGLAEDLATQLLG
jgi:adenylosuccinate lyase